MNTATHRSPMHSGFDAIRAIQDQSALWAAQARATVAAATPPKLMKLNDSISEAARAQARSALDIAQDFGTRPAGKVPTPAELAATIATMTRESASQMGRVADAWAECWATA